MRKALPILLLLLTSACGLTSAQKKQLDTLETNIDALEQTLHACEAGNPECEKLSHNNAPNQDVGERLAVMEMKVIRLRQEALRMYFPETCEHKDAALPKTEEAQEAVLGVQKLLFVAADGQYFVAGEPVGPAALKALMENWLAQDADVSLVIQAAQETPYQLVADAMQLARDAGIRKQVLATRGR